MEKLLSVGIDIGTSTTQVVFSRFTLDNTAGYFSAPRVDILDKQVVYKSQIYFTPLKTASLIDGAGVRQIVEKEYQAAGMRPEDVQTGAVIITGESARKENAAEVLRQLSDLAGDFVVSTAGPDLESVIAGKGSGAWQWSQAHQQTAVNLDVGGGTTNLVLFRDGEAEGVGCFDIGGRLIRLSPQGVISYISPAAALVAEALGLGLSVGLRAEAKTLAQITDKMARLLAECLGLQSGEPLLSRLQTPGSSTLSCGKAPARLFFSGGVAACMERPTDEPFAFGDIGVLLARSLQAEFSRLPVPFQTGGETLRATVVGAGTYTTALSGSTIFYTPGVFPLKNVPVCRLSNAEQEKCLLGEDAGLTNRLRQFLAQTQTETLALVLPGVPDPTYRQLQGLAAALSGALDAAVPQDAPLLVSVASDMAKALGGAMHRRLPGRRLAVLDSVQVGQNDYMDVGRPVMDGLVVPVIVKTLLFG